MVVAVSDTPARAVFKAKAARAGRAGRPLLASRPSPAARMDAEHPTSPRHLLGRVVATLLALLLLYPLSAGPAVYLAIKLKSDFKLVDRFYAPLLWATHDAPLKQLLDDYVRWWSRLAGLYVN